MTELALQYDRAGAGTSWETMTYNTGSRLVTSVEGAVVSTYTFDANGNQTAVNAGGSRTTYAYDYENRMRTAIDPGGARSTMAYWADGMRRFLEVGGTRTTFVWDGSDYLQSRTPSEVTTFSTVDAQILDSETGGSESLLVPDPLGSVVWVLDASGNQLYDAWYWAYGETRLSVGVNNTPWGYGGTWGYHFDMSRRLYIRARVLDPVTGRWYSVDSLWPRQLAYAYAGLSPCNHLDFFGTQVMSGDDAMRGWCGQWDRGLRDFWDNLWPKPQPQPITDAERKQNYRDGWTPWTFEYGNCCGAEKRCNRGYEAIDCLDRACREHDARNPNAWEYAHKKNHVQLCTDLFKCSCSEYKPGTTARGNCESARAKMQALYCLHVSILPM